MKKITIISILMLLSISSYGQNSNDNKLIGTWDLSFYFSKSDVAKMSKTPLPSGLSMEMTMSGSETYHVNHNYSGLGNFTLRITQNGKEIPLRFMIRETGTWKIYTNILAKTTVDTVVTPMDELTKSIVSQSPSLQNMVAPISGETTSIRIIYISDSFASLEILGPPKIKVSMNKSN